MKESIRNLSLNDLLKYMCGNYKFHGEMVTGHGYYKNRTHFIFKMHVDTKCNVTSTLYSCGSDNKLRIRVVDIRVSLYDPIDLKFVYMKLDEMKLSELANYFESYKSKKKYLRALDQGKYGDVFMWLMRKTRLSFHMLDHSLEVTKLLPYHAYDSLIVGFDKSVERIQAEHITVCSEIRELEKKKQGLKNDLRKYDSILFEKTPPLYEY